jgi:hypothetical protein
VKQAAIEERCEVVELVEKALNEYMQKSHTHTHTLMLKGDKTN